MKRVLNLSILFLVLIISDFSASAQGGFNITNLVDSTYNYNCDSIIEIAVCPVNMGSTANSDATFIVEGFNFDAGPVSILVNWGDGSTTTHNGQMTTVGTPIQWTPALTHLVMNPTASQTITVTVTNSVNGTNAAGQVTLNAACAATIYGFVSADCDIDSLVTAGIPFNLIGNNGNTATGLLDNGMTTVTGIIPDYYSFEIDPTWLSQNGLQQLNITPTGIYLYPGSVVTFQALLTCDSVVIEENCISGYVYCDMNQNGVMDAQDYMLQNALLNITSGNQTVQVTTNANGYYSWGAFDQPGTTYSIVQVDQAWAAQNGYFVQNPTLTVIDSLCSLGGSTANFAIICDSSQLEEECVGGWVFCDQNQNGYLDGNEIGFANAPITITGTNSSVTVYTNSVGQFNYTGTQLGSEYATVMINPNWLAQNGYTTNTTTWTVLTDCDTTWPVYFPINCDTNQSLCADLWTLVDPWIGYYQNQNNYVKLRWGNYGPAAAQSYTVTLNFPAGVTPVTSSIMYPNYVISGNSISWTFNSNSTYIYEQDIIYFFVPAGFPSGTQHYYTSTIVANGNNQDCNASNNADTLMMILGNSYDPNDKTVNSSEIINPDVADELTYRIRFQNTGTAPAQDVYILDTLSSNLDWSTFELLDATHHIEVINLGNGVMKFNFPDIWLPDSTANEPESHGSLTYRIKEYEGNGIGTEIFNTAYIYFDWNPAIVTNTTHNINMVLGVDELETDNLLLYPNPVGEVLTIRSDRPVTAVKIYDLTGKLVYSKEHATEIETVRTTTLNTGVYIVELEKDGAWVTRRFIKK